jgi:hypothetical protein
LTGTTGNGAGGVSIFCSAIRWTVIGSGSAGLSGWPDNLVAAAASKPACSNNETVAAANEREIFMQSSHGGSMRRALI